MNLNQLGGLLRMIIPAIVMYLVGRGVIPEEAAPEVIAAIVALGAAVWSWVSNSNTSEISRVSNMDGVKRVVASASIARGTNARDVKVTTT